MISRSGWHSRVRGAGQEWAWSRRVARRKRPRFEVTVFAPPGRHCRRSSSAHEGGCGRNHAHVKATGPRRRGAGLRRADAISASGREHAARRSSVQRAVDGGQPAQRRVVRRSRRRAGEREPPLSENDRCTLVVGTPRAGPRRASSSRQIRLFDFERGSASSGPGSRNLFRLYAEFAVGLLRENQGVRAPAGSRRILAVGADRRAQWRVPVSTVRASGSEHESNGGKGETRDPSTPRSCARNGVEVFPTATSTSRRKSYSVPREGREHRHRRLRG